MDMLPDKRLKRRLKKLEGIQGGNLQEEKLFEVRIHGLSLYVFFFSFFFPLIFPPTCLGKQKQKENKMRLAAKAGRKKKKELIN